VSPVLLAQVLPHPQLNFPSKIGFFRIYLNFQWQKSLQNQYLPHSESKSYQKNPSLNPDHQDLSKNTKGTFHFLRSFQLRFNLLFSEEIIQYSETFAPQVQTSRNQAHAPLLIESFPKTPRTESEASWFSGSDKNKQNKQTTFLHRFCVYIFYLFYIWIHAFLQRNIYSYQHKDQRSILHLILLFGNP